MIHVHQLTGCAPAPLAHYLKAIGILRLVSEQVDHEARGWWDGDHFRLASSLSQGNLIDFFLHAYQPTPIISPWNKGSGFFQDDDRGLSPIESSQGARFAPFRLGIAAGRSQLEELKAADAMVRNIKAETKIHGMSTAEKNRIKQSEQYKQRLREADNRFKQLKTGLIPELRKKWRGPNREWMDAAMVLNNDGSAHFPALLGTGGNDGNLDFTNNFMQRLGELFNMDNEDGSPRRSTSFYVKGSLLGCPIPGNLKGKRVGQFLPGTAGGANNGNGPRSDSIANPMEFVLMLEGALAFTSHATKRFALSETSRAASPFALNPCGAAYASASAHDESPRGEQWMPLWSRPVTYRELRQILAEGRSQLGTKATKEPLDFARAVARLGTSRGISAFQRYGYLERNGQSNLAVPLGRFRVAEEQSGNLACLDDLDLWLPRLRREARDKAAPTRLVNAEKRLIEAIFSVTGHPDDPQKWQMVLLCLGDMEAVMRQGTGFAAQPVPRLRPEWVTASYDGTPEYRLALAFALQAANFRRDSGTPIDPIRRHWLPLDKEQPWRFATTGTGSGIMLDMKPEVVMHGRRGLDDAIALIERRMIESSQREGRHLPLKPARGTVASTADLNSLLSGKMDLDRVLVLGRALMALGSRAWAKQRAPIKYPRTIEWPDDAWLAIRLCTLPWPLKIRSGFELNIGTDPAIVRRLAAGDAASALTIALRRLKAAGVNCTLRTGVASYSTARLWAAALAFPINRNTAEQFLHRLDPNLDSGTS